MRITRQNSSAQAVLSNLHKMDTTRSKPANKKKLPIWDSIQRTPRPCVTANKLRSSKRLSALRTEEIYSFVSDASPQKKSVARGKKDVRGVKKTRKRFKNPYPSNKFSKGTVRNTYLTTDPSWQVPLSRNISVSSFYKKKYIATESTGSTRGNENSSVPSEFDSHFDDVDTDDPGYEASISVTNETNPSSADSVFTLPTPRVAGRFPGTTSTPRDENLAHSSMNINEHPVCVQEELKICFGFDDSPDDDNLGFSPVFKPPHLSNLNFHAESYCTTSDTGDIESLPTRFALPLRRPLTQVQNHQPHISHSRLNHRKRHKDKEIPKLGSLYKSSMLQNAKPPENTFASVNNSVLFENTEDNTENISSPVKQASNCERNVNLSSRIPYLPSPEKCFAKPPRNSYTRHDIEAAKRKFHENLAGGYPTTDTDTDTNEPNDTEKITRRKKRKVLKSPMQFLKNVYDKKDFSRNRKKLKALGTTRKENLSVSYKKSKTKKKQNSSSSDKSVEDWASDLNSHFSEVEEIDLIVE